MKGRVVISVLCLTLAFAVSLFGLISVQRACGELSGAATAALEAPPAERPEAVFALLAGYEKHSRALGVFLKHADADALRTEALRLAYAVRSGDDAALKIALQEFSVCVGEITEGEKMKWENIL